MRTLGKLQTRMVKATTREPWLRWTKPGRLELGAGIGLVVAVGGCGTADVFRAAPDTFVAVEHYSDDSDDELEAVFLRTLRDTPTQANVTCLGSVDVSSGVLALVAMVEPVDAIEEAKLARSVTWSVDGD